MLAFIFPYKSGYRFPEPDKKQEKREYAITLRQRELERNVRKWQIKAIENKGLDESEYKKAKQNAIFANKEYIEFSKKHNRAYYPSRVQVSAEEKDYFQYNEWAKIIGKENMPKTLDKFQEIRCNDEKEYRALQEFKQYRAKNPETSITREEYQVVSKIKEIGFKGEPILKPDKIDTKDYPFSDDHINKTDHHRNITKEQAEGFIDRAVFSLK